MDAPSGASGASGNQQGWPQGEQEQQRATTSNNDDNTSNDNKSNKSNKKKQCRTVHNFDLWQNSRGNVTVCNIADVPLPDGSVDACVFCLSLMGTDYGAFLVEAARILRGWGPSVDRRGDQPRRPARRGLQRRAGPGGRHRGARVLLRVQAGGGRQLLFRARVRGRRRAEEEISTFPELRACAYKKR